MESRFFDDLLNAGIGLFKTGKEGAEKAKKELAELYGELKKKGAEDTSESAKKIRGSMEHILQDLEEFTSQAGKNYEETKTKLMENYENISVEIRNRLPQEKITEIKSKIEEITNMIKNFRNK